MCRLTYSKMEAYDSAVECYEKALKLDPENTGYKNNLEIAQKKSAVSWLLKMNVLKLKFKMDFDCL